MKDFFNKEFMSKMSLVISILLITFLFTNILFTSLLFIFDVPVGYIQLVLSIIATLVTGLLLLKREGVRKITFVFGTLILLIASSLFLTSVTIEDTVDGPYYHQPAVGAMKYGWNPVYQSIGEFNESSASPIKIPAGTHETWMDHYPKAHWIYGANLYHATGNMEMGRSMAVLVVLALFFLALSYFLRRFRWGVATFLALVIALNPISLAQMFSYYNDGMMGNLLFMLILLFTLLVDRKYPRQEWINYLFIAMIVALIINIKFTGLLYAAVYSLTYFWFIALNKKTRKSWWKVGVTGLSALVVGLFIIGLSAYPKNFVEQGNPLYPLMGTHDTVDIITSNQPASFDGMNNLKKLFIANFSETDNISAFSGEEPVLKIPFAFSLSELPYLSYADPRIGGYGVWFSGILFISILVLGYYVIKTILRKRWDYFWLITLPLIPTALLLFLMSDAWWARYFPQMYLLPVIALVILCVEKRKIVTNVLAFAILFNIVLSLSVQISALKSSIEYSNAETKLVDELTENGQYTPRIYLNRYGGGYAYRYYDRYGKIEILDKKIDDPSVESVALARGIIVYK